MRHAAHLCSLKQQGKLHLCGPFADDDGAFLLIEASSLQEAEAFAKKDPFIVDGYYADAEVHELIESNESNNWLMDDPQTKENMKKPAP